MANIVDTILNFHLFDELAAKKTFVHELHPLSKILVTFAFLVTVISFDKYELSALLPFFLYPALVFSLGEIPIVPIMKRVLAAAGFVLFIGIFNPLLDRQVILTLAGLPISGGLLSFLTLMIKGLLSITGASLLLATSGIGQIAAGLTMLRLPRVMVQQFLLTYRYVTVLIDEMGGIWIAYSLRAPLHKGIRGKAWGPLLGQVLLRTYDRALRIHEAMVLRGFKGEYPLAVARGISRRDVAYIGSWLLFFAAARFVNLSLLLGTNIAD